MKIYLFGAVALIMVCSVTSCAVKHSADPTTTWEIDNPHPNYPELKELTRITKDILASSKKLNERALAAYPLDERLRALRVYVAEVEPYLSKRLGTQLFEDKKGVSP